jgi:undecaprenyl phosphate N,N'-diacetylbacillosamine 1-phosphate transferase
MYTQLVKPFFDFLFALIALVIISPILILVTILLAIVNKGQPFFVQRRPGKNGHIFMIIKFRTMTSAKDQNGILLPDADRLTSTGKLIRKTSVDELPQLLNILKGDMSFIGPRPLLPQYLSIYTPEQMRRHDVKPGITGWAQVNGRNAISWTQKFQYDIQYVNNISFFLDLKILFMTIKKVLISEGINTENMATTKPFNGSN